MPDPGDHGVPRHGREPGPGPRPGLGAVPVLVRPDGTLLPGVDDQAAWPAGGGDELSWSFRCDLAGALAGLDLPLAGPGDGDQEQLLAELAALDRATAGPGTDADQAAGAGAAGPDAPAGGVAAGPEGSGGDAGSDRVAGGPACADGSGMPGSGVLGRVADALPAGPGLAAWVAQCPAGQLADADLPAAAAALRRVTSWAQAAELAVVAQIAARSAARDPRTGLGQDGCPAAVTRDAAAQAGLALTLSPGAASWWADLAVTLGWRLPGTGAALLAGEIDLARARIIAEATAVLDDQAARAVEDQVLLLPGAENADEGGVGGADVGVR